MSLNRAINELSLQYTGKAHPGHTSTLADVYTDAEDVIKTSLSIIITMHIMLFVSCTKLSHLNQFKHLFFIINIQNYTSMSMHSLIVHWEKSGKNIVIFSK